MTKLIDIFPVLAKEVARALRTLGRAEFAQQVEEAVVVRVTFDNSAGAGYIYVEPSSVLNVVDANVIGSRHGETITVDTQFDAVIDTDNFARVTGIDILTPGVLKAELGRRASG